MGKTSNNIGVSSENLFVLFRDMRKLFPQTTIEEFEEIIDQDGYYDTRQRMNIQSDSINEIRGMWYGRGFHRVKELWDYFTTNRFHEIIDADLYKLSKLYKEKTNGSI